jgi:hypothetical protein
VPANRSTYSSGGRLDIKCPGTFEQLLADDLDGRVLGSRPVFTY